MTAKGGLINFMIFSPSHQHLSGRCIHYWDISPSRWPLQRMVHILLELILIYSFVFKSNKIEIAKTIDIVSKYVNLQNPKKDLSPTRMHSSRMHTTRSLLYRGFFLDRETGVTEYFDPLPPALISQKKWGPPHTEDILFFT